jgi:tRNA uracil 4-sulfurtransferase
MTKKGLVLLSSGIDSPVAMYLMSKKGYEIDAVNFNNSSDENSHAYKKVLKIINQLSKILNKTIQLYSIDYKKIQQTYNSFCNTRNQCILCKRGMIHTCELLCKKFDYSFIINGDNLGQVASQTLRNLKAVDTNIKTPIYRPLISFDKNEIITIAKEINTFEISSEKEPNCPFVPHNPVTRIKTDTLLEEEKKINISDLIKKNIEENNFTIKKINPQ